MPSEQNSAVLAKIARGLAYVSPSLPLFLLATVGSLLEITLLGLTPDSVFKDSGIITFFVACFVIWFWFTLAWCLWGAERGIHALTATWSALAQSFIRGLLMVVAALVTFLYLTSWGLYLQARQFANVESIRFAVGNAHQLWLYLLQSERLPLAILGLAMVMALGVLPFFFSAMAREGWSRTGLREPNRTRRLIWYSFTILWVVLFLVVHSDKSGIRRGIRMDLLAHCVNPILTLAASWENSLRGEKIEPCLDVSELQPIMLKDSKDAWAPGKSRPCIIFVTVESLRHDVVLLVHQGREVMPNLNHLAREGLHLTRAYSQTTHTDYSTVSVVSSLYPLRTRVHHNYQARDPWPKTLFYDLLKPAGYATALFSSQNEGWGGMDKFFQSPNLDLFFDSERSGAPTHMSRHEDTGFAREIRSGALRAGSLDDGLTTDKAITWVRQQSARGKPFFMGLNFQDSHFSYELPPDLPHPFQPCELDFQATFMGYPAEKADVMRNAYYNALHECDRQLGRLVDALRKLGLRENTILVVYGDHGEAFHENGLVTHAGKPIESVVRTACVIHAPRYLHPRTDDYPVALIDIVPTLLGLMGWPAHSNFQGVNFLAPDRTPLDQRLLFLHTETPMSRVDAIVLAGRWKYIHDRHTGEETLFDLSVDSGEKVDIAQREPALRRKLSETLAAWRRRQLAYYHYPFYYENYYPPRPPRWEDVSAAKGKADTASNTQPRP